MLLRTTMTTNDDEGVRKACHAGLRSIGTFIAPQFVEIIKLRNKLAHKLGYVDYYDYKVRQAEGFSKERLFQILEPLEERTRQLMLDARAQLAREGPRGLGAAATAATATARLGWSGARLVATGVAGAVRLASLAAWTLVDTVLRRGVRPLLQLARGLLRALPGIAGTALLDDGAVLLVLDLPELAA